MGKLKIKLRRSLIGRKEGHRRTIRALGLGKIDSEVVHDDSPQIRGMIKQVSYLVDVEELSE